MVQCVNLQQTYKFVNRCDHMYCVKKLDPCTYRESGNYCSRKAGRQNAVEAQSLQKVKMIQFLLYNQYTALLQQC